MAPANVHSTEICLPLKGGGEYVRDCVVDADGRLAAVLGLEVLKLSESASTASFYPGLLSVSLRSCPVAVHIFL